MKFNGDHVTISESVVAHVVFDNITFKHVIVNNTALLQWTCTGALFESTTFNNVIRFNVDIVTYPESEELNEEAVHTFTCTDQELQQAQQKIENASEEDKQAKEREDEKWAQVRELQKIDKQHNSCNIQ